MSDPRETRAQKGILLALSEAFHPGIFWRQNAGKVQTVDGYWVELGQDGIAGIVGFLPGGQIVFIECKRKTGKQRKTQEGFERAVSAAGAIYVVARSSEDAVSSIRAAAKRITSAVNRPPNLPKKTG